MLSSLKTLTQIVIFSLLAVFFWRCDEASPEKKVTSLFSVVVDPSYSLKKDTWIMISDKNGKLLDHKQITTSGVVTFETSNNVPDNRISVTLFNYDSTSFGKSYGFTSYFGLPLNDAWTLKTPPVTQTGGYTPAGLFTVRCRNMPNPLLADHLYNGYSFGSFNTTSDVKTWTMGIYENYPSALLTIAGNGNPRYKFFEDPKKNDYFDLSFNELAEYDHVLDMSFPAATSHFVKVTSIDEANKNYYLYYTGFNLFPASAALTNLKIGYLNRFNRYMTTIQLALTGYVFLYEKRGTRPTSITVPDHATFRITNKTFTDYAFIAEKPFMLRESFFFDSPSNTTWKCYAPEGTDKINEMPQDFLKKYPSIDITKLGHSYTNLMVSTIPYTDFIATHFKGKGQIEEYETIGISF
jgi:hypothetical protein